MRAATQADRFILAALAMIVVVTVGWWAAALWPLPATTPEWVLRARAACFGSGVHGLPDSGGWILLIGTPLTMVGALLVIAPRETRRTLGTIRHSRRGRWVLGATAAGLTALLALAVGRVSSLYGLGPWESARADATVVPNLGPRVSRPAPSIDLTDHRGVQVTLDRFLGRPVIVTFAYGKCETVCPVVVHNVLTAQAALAPTDVVVLIVTLDPWRDTPGRLPHIAKSWELSDRAHLLGGSVAGVETVLEGWRIDRSRDPRTGDIAHASVAYVIDREGRIAFVTSASVQQIVDAVRLTEGAS
jgi:cytochrome oxidase Cu insertion factor (SCO1/SenC/PrrC family)